MSSEMDVFSIITPSPHKSTSSSLLTIPVACHVTEHVLIDNYGNLTVNIPDDIILICGVGLTDT
jgi:hypothetical protein